MSEDAQFHPGRHETTPREAALAVLRRLRAAGYTAYFAGGCVRDRLMDIEPKDYDIATDARPEQIRALFPRAHGVGEAFGVILVRRDSHLIEIATFRSDGRYSDGRHPDAVSFSDAEHDARRRDFTINGLFEDPLAASGAPSILDFVNGRADIESRVIRAIGDPDARFSEDHLRMLRAVRFAARFGFSIDGDTALAVRQHAAQLRNISRERIGQEIRWMLSERSRAVAAWEVQYLGLDAPVFNEDNRTVAPTRLGRLPDEVDLATALAAWALDRAAVGSIEDAAIMRLLDIHAIIGRWSDALVLSNAERDAMQQVLEVYRAVHLQWWSLGVARKKRLAASPHFNQAMLILQTIDRQFFVALRRDVAHLAESKLAPQPFINGQDLIGLELTPGPIFSRLLEAAYDAQLEGAVRCREDALQLVRALLNSGLPER